MLLTLHVSAKYDLATGAGTVELSVGAPARISEMLETVRKALLDKLDPPSRGTPSPPAPDAVGREEGTAQAPAALGSPISNPASPTGDDGAGDRSAHTPLRSSAVDLARIEGTLEYCSAVVARIGEAWCSGELMAALGGEDRARALFRKPTGKDRNAPGYAMFEGRPFRLGFGIVARRNGSGPLAYRPAVRVQSPTKPLSGTMTKLSALMDKFSDSRPETRWTSPVVACPSNADGYPPPHDGPPRIGSPVGVAGGADGALGIFLLHGDTVRCVVAGHVVFDDGMNVDNLSQFPEGRPLYYPMQPYPAPAGAEHMGVVEVCEVYEASPIHTGPSVPSSTRDFCIVRMSPGHAPKQADRLRMGRRQFAATWWRGEIETGLRVVKSPARSTEQAGEVHSDLVTVEIYNALTQQVQVSSQIVEVALDVGEPGAEFGDSGRLLCAEVRGALCPLGIVVAKARTSLIDGPKAKSRALLYVQSFDSFLSNDPRFADYKVA